MTRAMALTLARRLIPTVPLIALPAQTAKAIEPATALAAGAAAASLLASLHRRDPTVPILQALRRELRLAMEQLNNIQTLMTEVLIALVDLKDQIPTMLAADRALELQQKLAAVVDSYERLTGERERFDNDVAWIDENNRDRLRQLLHRVEEERSRLEQTGEGYSPASALVVPSAGFVELSLMMLLGFQERSIVARIEDVWLPWTQNALDPDQVNSTAWVVADAAEQLQALHKQLDENSIGDALGRDGQRRPVACIGVDVFQNATIVWESYLLPFEADGGEVWRKERIPALTGPRERLFRYGTLLEKPMLLPDGKASEVLGLEFDFEKARRKSAPKRDPLPQGTPPDSACHVIVKPWFDGKTRSSLLQSDKSWKDQITNLNKFRTLIFDINKLRALFAFGVRARASVQIAADRLVELRATYA